MRDKRPVDELSIEELERILVIRKREQRLARFRKSNAARTVQVPPPVETKIPQRPLAQPVEQLPVPAAVVPQNAMTDFEAVRFVDDMKSANPILETDALWRQYLSVVLLVVEIAAVLGLAAVLYRAFIGLEIIQDNTNKTQREYEAALNRPTSTPAPELSPYQIVLPGGHTSPTEGGDPEINLNELYAAFDFYDVPANQRPAIERQIRTTRALERELQPTDPERIDIPSLGIQGASIVPGIDWESLKSGIGWFQNGARLGSRDNVVLVGHNDIYGEIFRYLEDLEVGDEVVIYAAGNQTYTYRVTDSSVVEPTEVRVLHPTNTGAHLTLITCHPYQVDTQRLIVVAELVQ